VCRRPRASGPSTLRRDAYRSRRGEQLGILDQDRALERLQLRARVEAELIRQQLSGPPVNVKGLALASLAVEREHQLATRPFPERVLGDEFLDLWNHVFAGGELRVDEIGFDCDLELVKPSRGVLSK
jgi:hypothetical protein